MALKFFLLGFPIFHFIVLVSSLNDEGLALLSFKQSLENSTAGYLNNWNRWDANPCSWNGVNCSQERVVSVSFPNTGLKGFLQLDGRKLVALQTVNLRNNYFFGSLPVGLFAATGLEFLILSGNWFSGPIADEIGNLKYLQSLDLSQNFLTGSVPSSLAHCKRLRRLALSQNSLTGSLPDGLGSNLSMLRALNLSFNNFTGSIPSDLGNLSSLQGVLDLSHNLFSRIIPASLGNLPELVYINLAYNNLSGPIPQNGALVDAGPTAFVGNTLLCGPPLKTSCPLGTSPQNPKAKPLAEDPSGGSSGENGKGHGWSQYGAIASVAGTLAGIGLIVFSFSCWYKKVYVHKVGRYIEGCYFEEQSMIRKEIFCFKTDDLESLSDNMEQYTFVPLDSLVNFDLEQLLKASAFLMGKGRVGIIYKVVLEKGPVVAVRRLENEGSQRLREFQCEVEAIGKIKHPNIVSILAYCWCINEKLLIYDYVPNGDLGAAIHGRAGVTYFKPLSWPSRLKIMKGVAKGLAFLHEFSPKRYVHGNLKPSNILLGDKMEPRISDFGLSRLAYTAEESLAAQLEKTKSRTPQQTPPYVYTPTNASTRGYHYEAPEVSKARKPSQKWDVYSFGVILLEMISGKSPTVQTGSPEVDLVQWFQLSTEVKQLSDVLDPFLARDLDKEYQIVSALKIALACAHVNPERRPSMRNVSENLERLASSTQ